MFLINKILNNFFCFIWSVILLLNFFSMYDFFLLFFLQHCFTQGLLFDSANLLFLPENSLVVWVWFYIDLVMLSHMSQALYVTAPFLQSFTKKIKLELNKFKSFLTTWIKQTLYLYQQMLQPLKRIAIIVQIKNIHVG